MQRFILILLICLTAGAAPLGAGELVGYGIKMGLNLADQSGKDHFFLSTFGPEGEKKSRIGFCFGGFLRYQITSWLELQPELLLSVKGAKYEETGSAVTDSLPSNYVQSWDNEETWKLSYIEVPLLIKFNIPLSRNLTPNLFLGPQVDINIGSKLDWHWTGSAKFETAVYDSLWDESSKEDIKNLNVLEFGLVMGAGMDLALTSSAITFDIRYNLTLSSNDSYEVEFTKNQWNYVKRENLDFRNSSFKFLLGYMF